MSRLPLPPKVPAIEYPPASLGSNWVMASETIAKTAGTVAPRSR